MKKHGFADIILGVMVGFMVLIIGLSLMPTVGQIQTTAFSNGTLFPTNGAAYNIGGLTTLFFIIAIIVGAVGTMLYRGQQG